jgi:hypothetical protein
MYFGRKFAWLKYFTHQIVPIQVPNSQQQFVLTPKVSIVVLHKFALSWKYQTICLHCCAQVLLVSANWPCTLTGMRHVGLTKLL